MTIRIVPRAADDAPDLIVGVDVQRMADDAIRSLVRDERVYQRGGTLVGVVTVPEDRPVDPTSRIGRATGKPVIRAIAKPTMRERLATNGKWLRHDGKKDAFVRCLPPDVVVDAVLARGEWQGIRNLTSVATAPFLRPDGTVLQTEGYDAQTGVLYTPDDKFIDVDDEPTLDNARDALVSLREIVCDFPFAKPEHRAAWLSFLLTMFARPAIDGNCPLFAIDATTPGIGKGRLVEVVSIIALGRGASGTTFPREEEEMRKRITGIVLEGSALVCLDNVRRAMTSESLEAILTMTQWTDRELGRQGSVGGPHRSVWCATGNNMVFGGDLPRRTIHSRLESQVENPEERTDYRHYPLLPWVWENRRRFVCNALTILRAYCHAGAPPQSNFELGSFEPWSKLVPGALVWCGETDPLLARASQSAPPDDSLQELRAIHDGLARMQGEAWLTTRDIVNVAFPDRHPGEPMPPDGYEDFRDALTSATRTLSGRTPDPIKVGKVFQRYRGRILGGRRLVSGELTRTRVATWRVG